MEIVIHNTPFSRSVRSVRSVLSVHRCVVGRKAGVGKEQDDAPPPPFKRSGCEVMEI